MTRTKDPDDTTSAGGDDYTLDDNDTRGDDNHNILDRIFSSCQRDPRGSVHRAWGVTVLFMVMFMVIACIEGNKIQQDEEAALALEIAAYYTAVLHLGLAILGTFVLKRFATAFTVGCFLGVTLVVSQQNLLMFVAFFTYQHGDAFSNAIFADLAFALFMLLGFFTLILGHFRNDIIE